MRGLVVLVVAGVSLAGCGDSSNPVNRLAGNDKQQEEQDKAFDDAANTPEPEPETPAPDVLCELGVVYSSVQCRDALEQACHDQGGHPLVGSSIVTCLYD